MDMSSQVTPARADKTICPDCREWERSQMRTRSQRNWDRVKTVITAAAIVFFAMLASIGLLTLGLFYFANAQ